MDLRSYIKAASLDDLKALRHEIDREVELRSKPAPGKKVMSFTDGASRGNPGKAGIGVILFDEKGEKILQDYKFVGECTNNEAEYRALLLALDRAYEVTQDTLECYMDSELVCRQMMGRYAVKSEKMLRFWQEARDRAARFRLCTFHHVPREHPRQQLADKLANKAIDEAKR